VLVEMLLALIVVIEAAQLGMAFTAQRHRERHTGPHGPLG
jgi:hypothetical protein